MTVKTERHTLYFRENLGDEPKRIREFATYRMALKAGMRELGHGKFWVDSERKEEGATKWTEFCPPAVSLNDLAEESLDGDIEAT